MNSLGQVSHFVWVQCPAGTRSSRSFVCQIVIVYKVITTILRIDWAENVKEK